MARVGCRLPSSPGRSRECRTPIARWVGRSWRLLSFHASSLPCTRSRVRVPSSASPSRRPPALRGVLLREPARLRARVAELRRADLMAMLCARFSPAEVKRSYGSPAMSAVAQPTQLPMLRAMLVPGCLRRDRLPHGARQGAASQDAALALHGERPRSHRQRRTRDSLSPGGTLDPSGHRRSLVGLTGGHTGEPHRPPRCRVSRARMETHRQG